MRLKKYLIEAKTGVTTKKDRTGHIHAAIVDDDGMGKTISTKGRGKDHVHKIFEWIVQPASGHVHTLSDV